LRGEAAMDAWRALHSSIEANPSSKTPTGHIALMSSGMLLFVICWGWRLWLVAQSVSAC